MIKKILLKNELTHYLLIIFCFSLIILWPLTTHPHNIPMTGVFQNTDFIVTHLTNARYVHDSMIRFGQIPLWNAGQFSGQPFASDTLSGYWYIPNWIEVIFPVPITFNILFLCHLIFAGWGMFLFLKGENLSPISALFGSLLLMASPKLVAYLGDGQLSWFFAFCWTPWLFIVFKRAFQDCSIKNSMIAGACLAVTFYADIRYGYFAFWFVTAYGISIFSWNQKNFLHKLLPIGALYLVFIVLIIGLLIPLINLSSISSRAFITSSDQNIFPIFWWMLTGLVVPQLGVVHEMVVYLGLAALFFGLLGILKKDRFWVAACLVSIGVSLGDNFFLYPLLNKVLPGASMLRVPSRVWFCLVFATAFLAAKGFDYFINISSNNEIRKMRLFTFGGICFVTVIILFISFSIQPVPENVWLLIVAGVPLFGLIYLYTLKRFQAKLILSGIFLLTLIDLCWVNSSYLQAVQLPETTSIIKKIENEEGLFRVYSPSANLIHSRNIQQANGINPVHLASYSIFMKEVDRYSTDEYSVSIPQIYIDEKTPQKIIAQAANPDTVKLGLLNVKYVVSSFPMVSNRLTLLDLQSGEYLYENLDYRERVWYEEGQVNSIEWSPNQIKIEIEGEGGNVIFSEVFTPGWKTTMDGSKVEISSWRGILRSVPVPSGKHYIAMTYQPLDLFLCACISLVGWGIIIGLIAYSTIRSKRET